MCRKGDKRGFMGVKIAEEWLAICAGCEVTILDLGEALLDLLPKLDFLHMPVLMDHKLYGQRGEKKKMEVPEADIGIITGSIRNAENVEVAREMREKCATLIALGSCACFGGIPALANQFKVEEVYEKVYRGSKSTAPAPTPDRNVPALTDRVYALDEHIKVDVYIPGCPPSPAVVEDALTALLEGRPFSLPERSVCDDCPTRRENKSGISLKRPLASPFPLDRKIEESRCLMELGYLCMGPVTRAGCGGKERVPRCIKGYMPCRGCFGPIRKDASPMIEMMGALASNGLDLGLIPDRPATFDRYLGAHGALKPAAGKKQGGTWERE